MSYEPIQLAETRRDISREHDLLDLLCFAEDPNNPILKLDSNSRIAFLLHHLLGHTIEDAALLTDLSEREFRSYLRSAYLQLALREVGPSVDLSDVLGEAALA